MIFSRMDTDMEKEYKNNTETEYGTKKGFAAKALVAVLALVLALAMTLSSCGSGGGAVSDAGITTTSAESLDNAVSKSEMFTDRDLSGEYDESEAETITLTGSSADTSATSGVSIDGSTVTISEEGVYIVSGTLTDGQIKVDADENAKVQIVLNGVDITSKTSAAVYVKSADKVFITLAEGTENKLANGGSFTADGDINVDGAVFAKDDITFNGSGSLTVESPAGHGIVGKDDVKFAGGTYTITAAKHGVQANDSVRMTQSDVTITAGDDKDGVHVSDDDAETSESFFYMADGTLTIDSQDDGIHADAEVIIEGGTIDITESYEGIEGLSIKISGGDITLTATDDGINAAGGGNSTSDRTFSDDDWMGGKGGGFDEGGTDGSIVISGGKIHVTAGGDGIDSNGSVEITGGYTVIEGPSQGDTSVIDFNSTGTITGGTFIGTGGAGMAENFTSAEQGLIAVNVGNQSAGSSVTLKDSSGSVIAETTPELDYAVVYVSTEDMTKGETYTLTAGDYTEEITLDDNIYSTLIGGMGGMHGSGLGGGGPRGGMNEDMQQGGSQDGDMRGGMDGMPHGGKMHGGPQDGDARGGMNGMPQGDDGADA